MKKLIVIALLAIMLIGMLSLVACKKKDDATVTTDEQKPADDTGTVVADTAKAAPVPAEAPKPEEAKKP